MKINKKTMNDLWKFHEFVSDMENEYIATSDDPCGEMNMADRIFVYSYAAQLWFTKKSK